MALIRSIILALLIACPTWAGVAVYTNDVLALDPAAHPISLQSGAQSRYTIYAVQSGTPIDLTGLTGLWTITDPRDDATLITYTGTLINAAAGVIRYTATPPNTMEAGVTYVGHARIYLGATEVAMIAHDYVSLAGPACSTCSVSGGSGSVSLSSTTIVNNVVSAGPSTINGIPTGGVTVAASGYGMGVSTDGNTITTTNNLPTPSTGTWQVLQYNGTNPLWSAIGAPVSTPGAGTNVQRITTTWPSTNTVVMPTSPVWLYAIGASANYSGAGGGSKGLCTLPAGTILECVVGTAGTTTTNGMPGGGRGITGATTNGAHGGGGLTEWRIAGTTGTNGLIVIGPGAGAGNNGAHAVLGGPGGGHFVSAQNGVLISGTPTGGVSGSGAYAIDQYGTGAAAGTNIDSAANGSLFQGGNATTNLLLTGLTGTLGGGGAGLTGGAGATKTNASGANVTMGVGGGGLGYVNTQYCSQGSTDRGANIVSGLPPYADRPGYTSGRGVGGSNPGCAWMEW